MVERAQIPPGKYYVQGGGRNYIALAISDVIVQPGKTSIVNFELFFPRIIEDSWLFRKFFVAPWKENFK